MVRQETPVFRSAMPTTRQVRALTWRLLEWYDEEKRDLPWRRTSNPYAILVSEAMLQQTQVAAVIPYYEAFMKRFPSVESLAAARESEVLRMWAGLGYYNRARHLHAAARKIVDEYDGLVPARFADLLFLPGVGRYMAGAVASIAFSIVAPAVDGNVARVLCRLLALAENPSVARVHAGLEEIALRLIPSERPGDFNQALMELGARVCTPARPECPACPVRTLCKALKTGNPLDYPATAKRPASESVEEVCAAIRRDGRYLVVRRAGDSGRYRKMWEFPSVELEPGRDPQRTLRDYVRETCGVAIRVDEEWAEIKHQVTKHKIRKRVFLCTAQKKKDEGGRMKDERRGKRRKDMQDAVNEEETRRWATLDEIRRLPLGAPHKRILDLLSESGDFFGMDF
ncbi:A/G-specific adenine glycosylase [Candidatus Sumerlaeota bacterium]|nr:A/G-specific adenine glycosylase [Candidatus Sumerlaeota bacterium]